MGMLSERGRVGTLAALGLCSLLASAALVAQEEAEAPLSLWTSDAPIASVLEQVVGGDVFDVRIGEGVEGRVSGRLEGSVGEVLEPLLERYRLSVHNDGSTVWFDRRDREVVERVALDSEREPALAAWALRALDEDAAPGRKGTISREGSALRVAGSRSFVQRTLARLSAARGALNETDVRAASASPPEAGAEAGAEDKVGVGAEAGAEIAFEGGADARDPGAEAPEAGASTSVWREPPEALAMPDAGSPAGEGELARRGAPFRSVTDIPGFHTEYR